MQLLIVCLTLLATVVIIAATVALLAVTARRQPTAMPDAAPRRVGHRVTVHTKQPDDQTLFGVVVGDFTDRLSLDDAEIVTRNGTAPLPGRQDIATSDISWIDVHALVAHTAVTGAGELVNAAGKE